MNDLRKITLACFFIILSILFFSCGAKHHLIDEVIYRDDNFTYDHLVDNGMIISGISSRQVYLTFEERFEYSTILSNVLLERLKGVHTINIMNTSQLLDKIGKEEYLKIMETLDEEKIFREETLRFMRDSIANANYILLAYIENENIFDRSSEYVESDESGEELITDYERIYLLTIEYQIYDLLQEKMVWNNSIHNEAEKTETRTTRTGCVESCIDNVINSILFGSPAEINREEVLAKSCEKFAENLSKTRN
jgi:hypothetical protein